MRRTESTGRSSAALARGKDGVLDGTRSACTRPTALLVAVILSIVAFVAPAAAFAPVVEADVDALADRAEAWTEARNERRDDARDQALALAEEARQAEADRLAAEEAARIAEAERRAAEEIARTTTTTTTARPTTTTAAPTTTTAAPTTTASEPPASASGNPTAAQWTALRQCESSGNYSVVSANGRYRGAYQFSQATWDWIGSMDHPSLVGVDPAAAAPGDQDAMALALWARRGWSPWPHCGALAASS